jgi:hypothetical protein
MASNPIWGGLGSISNIFPQMDKNNPDSFLAKSLASLQQKRDEIQSTKKQFDLLNQAAQITLNDANAVINEVETAADAVAGAAPINTLTLYGRGRQGLVNCFIDAVNFQSSNPGGAFYDAKAPNITNDSYVGVIALVTVLPIEAVDPQTKWEELKQQFAAMLGPLQGIADQLKWVIVPPTIEVTQKQVNP